MTNLSKPFTPRELHHRLLDGIKPSLAFDTQKNFYEQKNALKSALEELVRVPKRTERGKIVV